MKLLAICVLLVLAGCPSKNDYKREIETAIAKMSGFTERMCACKDKACADRVQEDMTTWGMEMAKRSSKKRDQPDEGQMKRMSDVAVRYSECFTKQMMVAPIAEEPRVEEIAK